MTLQKMWAGVLSVCEKLEGYKTYITMAVLVCYAVYGWYIGDIDQERMVELVFQALGISAVRHGIAKK